MNKKIIFYIILICLTTLFFYFNYYATDQQYIFSKPDKQITGTNFGMLIAKDIIKYKKYVHTFFDGMNPAFYPLWGYPLLNLLGIKLGNFRLFLLIIQGILAIHGVYIFYKLFNIKERFSHFFLFIPFIGMLSVKWPDGIVCYLGFLFYYFIFEGINTKKWKYIIYSGIVLGIISNFRSEYFLLPLFLLIFIPLAEQKLEIPKMFLFKSIIMIFLLQIICILPWTIRSIRHDGKIRFTSTNGGAVFYSSLGQLPNNPWGLKGDDPDFWEFAQTHNEYGELVEKKKIDLQKISPLKKNIIYSIMERYRYDRGEPIYEAHFSPEGPKGDKLLRKEAIKLIKQHPDAFAKKVIYNFLLIFRVGLYTNEFEKFNITTAKHKKMDADFQALDKKEKIQYLGKALILKDYRRVAISYGINTVFRIIFPLLLIFFFVSPFVSSFKYKSKIKRLFYILLPIIIYKILLVSFIQYAPRQLNFIYIFLLGYFFAYTQGAKIIRKRTVKTI